jgi:hypothetical protein
VLVGGYTDSNWLMTVWMQTVFLLEDWHQPVFATAVVLGISYQVWWMPLYVAPLTSRYKSRMSLGMWENSSTSYSCTGLCKPHCIRSTGQFALSRTVRFWQEQSIHGTWWIYFSYHALVDHFEWDLHFFSYTTGCLLMSTRIENIDDLRSAAKMGGESCPTGRANFVSTKSSETFP